MRDWFKRRFNKGDSQGQNKPTGIPEIPRIGPAENPWKVSLLDVRPVTLGMISASTKLAAAESLNSFSQEDGLCFVGVNPPTLRTAKVSLQYRIGQFLADGPLFIPREMEHKWALFFHRDQIICVRSWSREIGVVADVRRTEQHVCITELQGTFVDEHEPPQFSERVLDFLVRSHALNLVYPAPIPDGMDADPRSAALWCMSSYGSLAHFCTAQPIPFEIPEQPLRTHSLLHIAVARGDIDGIATMLERGVPIDLLAQDGLTPLHWSLASDDIEVMEWLIRHGHPVDARSVEGATPLMNAVQDHSPVKVASLLENGADPNAADQRGFTALHRAAEMGEFEIAKLLLDNGALPNPVAQGHTPRSLAMDRGNAEIVELLNSKGLR